MNANTMSFCSLLLVLLVAGQQRLANAMKACAIKIDHFRLPTRVLPTHYTLNLNLYHWTSEKTFSGTVEIGLEIRKMTQWIDSLIPRTISKQIHPLAICEANILLNVEGLDVTNVEFKQKRTRLAVIEYCHDADNKILLVRLSKKPKLGTGAKLYLEFNGKVNTEAKGLFLSHLNPEMAALVTNLKPNYARRLFPCFDEPEFKASFQLTIWHLLGTIALSNMKSLGTDWVDSNLRKTCFESTPKMSSYLLSLAVGKFNSISKKLQGGVPITVYMPVPMDRIAMLDKAMKADHKLKNFFTDLTRPFEKIDIVAVDKGPIATESWGLITMRWDLLTADARTTKPDDWIRAITALMTQMINQWLAKVVTISWWDDLWLQKGLAAHLASELTASLPEIDGELYSLVDTTFSAMNDEPDPQKAHPTKDVDLETADQLNAWYDSIPHKKAAALVRMLVQFLGKDNFKSAILHFISSKDVHGLVDVGNWWDALSSTATLRKIGTVARQWIRQQGYPTISVNLHECELLVSQRPEFANGQIWSVPIQYEFHGDYIIRGELLLFDQVAIPLPEGFNIYDKNHWYTLNPNYQGYYLVLYSNRPILPAHGLAILSGEIPIADLLQMLSNTYFYAKQTDDKSDFERMLSWLGEYEEIDDRVMLLLTRILNELYDSSNFPSNHLEIVTNLMINYYRKNGDVSREADSNAVKQCSRGQVVDCLINRLNNYGIFCEVWGFKIDNIRLPPFLEHVDKYLPV